MRLADLFDPIANLWAVFATHGGSYKAVHEPRGLKLLRAFNTRAQAVAKIRDRMVTAGDIYIAAMAQSRPDRELVAQGDARFFIRVRSAPDTFGHAETAWRCPLTGQGRHPIARPRLPFPEPIFISRANNHEALAEL